MVLACLVTCLRTASRGHFFIPASQVGKGRRSRGYSPSRNPSEASESAINTLGHQVPTNLCASVHPFTSGRSPILAPRIVSCTNRYDLRAPPLPGAPAVGSSRPAGSHRDPCSLTQSPPRLAHISRSTQRIRSHSAHPRIAHGLSQPSSLPRRMRPRPRPPHRARSPARGLRTHRRRAPA